MTVNEDLVFAELPDPSGRQMTHAFSPRHFLEGAWTEPLAKALGLVPVAEARAWMAERLAPSPRIVPQVRGRLGERQPIPREGGNGTTSWRIRGRKVAIRTPSAALELPVEQVDAHIPADLPAPFAAELRAAVALLLPLPCPCGTGERSPEEHGFIRVLGEAGLDGRRAVTGRCERCARAWTFGPDGVRRASFDGEW